MRLNKIKPNRLRVKSKKRLGRGPASGLGKTSGRGHKGLRSRSGGKVRAGFEGGQMPLQKRVPKYGFSSRSSKKQKSLRLSELLSINKEKIDMNSLYEKKLISKSIKRVKVFRDTEECKKVVLKGIAVSSSVRALIEKSGGSVED